MKNMGKMIRDHRRLVLGNTGKYVMEIREKENIGFQSIIRSRSISFKTQPDPLKDSKNPHASLGNKEHLASHRRASEKPRPVDVNPHAKHFTTHIQKRERLTINNLDHTPTRSKENLKCRPLQHFFDSPTSSLLDAYLLQLLTHLREVSFLSPAGECSYTIHQEHLKQLLHAFLSSQSRPIACKSPQIEKVMKNLIEHTKREAREEQMKRLKLHNNTIEIWKQDEGLAKLCESKIMKLSLQQRKLEEEVQKLAKYEERIKSECQNSQAMVNQKRRELQQLHQSAHRQQQQLYRLRQQVQQAEQVHRQFLQADSKVKNFITEQQANRLIKDVFEEYKQIEADIYDYAAYLQSNQLASDLTYEPHPFRAIEKQVDEQLRIINTMLIQGSESVQEKSVAMRDFVLDAMGKFKRKDEEMEGVLEFRTKCIIKFIDNMKRWLNNWEFKQEFLVNLRKQFAYDSTLLLQHLQQLPLAKGNEELVQVMALTKKIIENYELGNSFY